jgi:hypothetical protein
VSQSPRYVTASPGVSFTWDGNPRFLRFGAVLDCPVGSALESAIGAGNLSGVIPASDPRRSPNGGGPDLSKAALAN